MQGPGPGPGTRRAQQFQHVARQGGPGAGAPAQPQLPLSWANHFPPTEFNGSDKRAVLVRQVMSTLQASPDGWRFLRGLQLTCEGAYCLEVDYKELHAAFNRAVGTQDLQEALKHQPADALACVSIAAHEV